ncbi:MAG: PHP domain-containing protein, partial [Gemmatimonadaceae bacterium]|nr:PHP domain-containing protein [Gemmatimonadaceae bacterium]
GALEPAAVVQCAVDIGLAAIALTDHDTLAGVEAARAAAAPHGLRVVAGVELSVHFHGRELHVLGLHVRDIAGLEATLDAYRADRVGRAAEIVRKLATLGVAITMDEVRAQASGASLGRPHVARALVARGYVGELREAFDRWLGNGRPAYVEKRRLELADALAFLHDAGALAIWAHPGRLGTSELVRQVAHAGMDGMEIHHPSHSPDDRVRFAELAERHGLLKSGGSDWHGQFDGPRQLGNQHVPRAWLDAQDARVAERAAARDAARAADHAADRVVPGR